MKANRARKKRFQREMTTDSEQNTQNENKIFISLYKFYTIILKKYFVYIQLYLIRAKESHTVILK